VRLTLPLATFTPSTRGHAEPSGLIPPIMLKAVFVLIVRIISATWLDIHSFSSSGRSSHTWLKTSPSIYSMAINSDP
jgi:hypothetical protein